MASKIVFLGCGVRGISLLQVDCRKSLHFVRNVKMLLQHICFASGTKLSATNKKKLTAEVVNETVFYVPSVQHFR